MNVSAFIVATGQLQRAMADVLPQGLGLTHDYAVARVVGGVVGNLLVVAAQDACMPPEMPREQECLWVLGLRRS